jgi:hypothetical protein
MAGMWQPLHRFHIGTRTRVRQARTGPRFNSVHSQTVAQSLCENRSIFTYLLSHSHIACKIKRLFSLRNWHTQRTQNPPVLSTLGFKSPSRHQKDFRPS